MADSFDLQKFAVFLAEVRAREDATKIRLPQELENVRDASRRAIEPIKPADAQTRANPIFVASPTNASRDLPPYYLIYFLLVDLLEFRKYGPFEKVNWSVPIDVDGKDYLIEHRKFGVGVFAPKAEEQQAQRIVALITKGVKAASPFFRWMATKAIQESKINVSNVADRLFERYVYFRNSYDVACADAETSKSEHDVKQKQRQFVFDVPLYSVGTSKAAAPSDLIAALTFPWVLKARNASWLALAAMDAFFAWTEHIFIHLAILQGDVTTGAEVVTLAGAEWSLKFKSALDIGDSITKHHFDELISVRRQLRNFMAHGAFGKQGQTFHFHSNAGAVPIALDRRPTKPHFSLMPELAFDDAKALTAIERFIAHLWSGKREPAKMYIQDSELPMILPMASDGTYQAAMASTDDMKNFIDNMAARLDAAANMDW
jgi:hypothetical protein